MLEGVACWRSLSKMESALVEGEQLCMSSSLIVTGVGGNAMMLAITGGFVGVGRGSDDSIV